MQESHTETYYIKITKNSDASYAGRSLDHPALQFESKSISNLIEWFKSKIEEHTWKQSEENRTPEKVFSINDHIDHTKDGEIIFPIEIPRRHYSTPTTIYLYYPINEHIPEMLLEPYIWFSKASKFNGPFETSNIFNNTWLPEDKWRDYRDSYKAYKKKKNQPYEERECREAFLEKIFNSPEDLDTILEDKIKAIETVSEPALISYFSRNYDNILMWSHYSNKHTGIVIGYDFKTLNSLFPHSGDVDYRRHKDGLSPGKMPISNQGDDFSEAAEYLQRRFFTKNPIWAYEQEYRFLEDGEDIGEGKRAIPKDAITEVYFGLKTDTSTKMMLLQALQGRNISCYEMQIDQLINLKRKRL